MSRIQFQVGSQCIHLGQMNTISPREARHKALTAVVTYRRRSGRYIQGIIRQTPRHSTSHSDMSVSSAHNILYSLQPMRGVFSEFFRCHVFQVRSLLEARTDCPAPNRQREKKRRVCARRVRHDCSGGFRPSTSAHAAVLASEAVMHSLVPQLWTRES